MVKHLSIRILTILLVISLVLPVMSCFGGPSSSQQNLSGKLIANVSQAKTDAERQTAIKDVLCQGLSLGLVDEKGNQLNRNVAQGCASLTLNDLAAMSYFISENQGYTIDDIVDFLAGAGILLSSNKQKITTKDILPDIQKYVDWSYAHRDDPRSLLGLVVASGPNMQVPGASPKFQGDTRISNVAGLMMLADILVGVPKEKKISANLFGNVAYAADSELQELAVTMQGLIAAVETGPEFKKLYDKWVETTIGEKSTATTTQEPVKLTVPDIVKKLVDAFATGSRFAVRLIDSNAITGPIAKSVELSRNSEESYPMLAVLVVVPSGQIVTGAPVTFTLNLIGSSKESAFQTGPLFPDADAVLESAVRGSSTEFDGHRLGIMPGDGIGKFLIMTNNCSNLERRMVLLHASAQISVPDFDTLMKQYAEKIVMAMGITGKSLAEVQAMYSVMQKNLNVTPWMCQVIIPPPAIKLQIVPDKLTGQLNKEYIFIAQGGTLPTGYRYEWTIENQRTGSEYRKDIVYDDKGELKYTFPKDGGYSILLRITNTSGQVYAEASAQAAIGLMPTPVVSLDIEVPGSMETLQSYNFTAKPNIPPAQLPPDTAWKWDFNDGTAPFISTYSTERFLIASHAYKKSGDYNIKLSLIDKTTKEELVTTTKKVTVSDLASMIKTNRVQITLKIYGVIEGDGPGLGTTLKSFGFTFYDQLPWTFKWQSDSSFVGTYINTSNTSRGIQATTQDVVGSMSLSPDGIKLTKLIFQDDFINPDYGGPGKDWRYDYVVELQNIPLTKTSAGDYPKFQYRVQGKDVAQYVLKSYYKEWFANGQQNSFAAIWDNIPADKVPELEIILDRLK